VRCQLWLPPEALPARQSSPTAIIGARLDELPLELGQATEDNRKHVNGGRGTTTLRRTFPMFGDRHNALDRAVKKGIAIMTSKILTSAAAFALATTVGLATTAPASAGYASSPDYAYGPGYTYAPEYSYGYRPYGRYQGYRGYGRYYGYGRRGRCFQTCPRRSG
jgi:hypothetical protein